ncbi:unnamed protein product [Brassica oleracea]
MHNLIGETIKPFHRRSVPFSVRSSATTTNSDQNFDQFNFQSLWHWSEFLVVATEEKIDRYLLAGKGFIFSSVEILVWMSFHLNNLDANNSEAFVDQRRCILRDVIS